MSPRRLYDLYCDALHENVARTSVHVRSRDANPAPAWPFLCEAERDVWRAIARRIRTSARRQA